MKTNEKVVLPREVAEAIKYLRGRGFGNFQIMRHIYGAAVTKELLDAKRWAFDSEGEGTPDLLMRALVNGYEVEATPEDTLREYYQRTFGRTVADNSMFFRQIGIRDGIEGTLDILGITIEGINGKETE